MAFFNLHQDVDTRPELPGQGGVVIKKSYKKRVFFPVLFLNIFTLFEAFMLAYVACGKRKSYDRRLAAWIV